MSGPDRIDRERLREAIADARKRQAGGDSYLTLLADAAEAHLATMPNKTVKVWHIESVSKGGEPRVEVCSDRVIAEDLALKFAGIDRQCIRITGPHDHEFPT